MQDSIEELSVQSTLSRNPLHRLFFQQIAARRYKPWLRPEPGASERCLDTAGRLRVLGVRGFDATTSSYVCFCVGGAVVNLSHACLMIVAPRLAAMAVAIWPESLR